MRRFFFELVNDRNYAIIPEIFDPAVQLRVGTRGVLGHGLDGLDGVVTWMRYFHDAFSDCRDEILGQWADGDMVVTHIRYTGTHDGPWHGHGPTGQPIVWTAVVLHTLRGGRIVRKLGAIDQADAFRQLGWLQA